MNLISLAVEELDVRSSCREEGITFRIRITFMLGSGFKEEMFSMEGRNTVLVSIDYSGSNKERR